MMTLGIETSCDETALALIETNAEATTYRILAQTVFSQIDIHAEFGGVFPVVAKREHARRLVPLLEHILKQSGISSSRMDENDLEKNKKVATEILQEKESDLLASILSSDLLQRKPVIDRIAVTKGPGLEPALWVGVNFARVLSAIWNIPIIPTNHMEGHIVAPLITDLNISAEAKPLKKIVFPTLALLISGGHTELVHMKSFGRYEIIGATLDDAVGEAFDKVARMMNLPYPGGPLISKLATRARARHAGAGSTNPITLPRPILHSPNFNFSFSGLKTSVLYLIRKTTLDEHATEDISMALEDAITEVLIKKTSKALDKYEAHTLVVGGGVIANTHIREALTKLASERNLELLMPIPELTGDNAVMIALAGAFADKEKAALGAALSAQGNLSL